MKNCYKKAFRLKKQKEISGIIRTASKCNLPLFSVFYEKNDLKQDRFNVLVSRKNGGAVARVRIKRIYREAYLNTEINVGEVCFYDILLRPHAGIEHKFEDVLKLYGKWRNEANKKSSRKHNLLPDTVC